MFGFLLLYKYFKMTNHTPLPLFCLVAKKELTKDHILAATKNLFF